MKCDKTGITFSTGRQAYANRGIIGLDMSGEVYEGYDGTFYCFLSEDEILSLDYYDKMQPTAEERKELADFMIARWKAYRDT